jgi:hypothetical protein
MASMVYGTRRVVMVESDQEGVNSDERESLPAGGNIRKSWQWHDMQHPDVTVCSNIANCETGR